MKTLIVGVGGVTNGGKSTLSQFLHLKIRNSCIVAQDSHFKDDRVVPVDSNGFKEYDTLDALHMDKMMIEVYSWRRDPPSFLRQRGLIPKDSPADNEVYVLIVEGFLIFNHRPLNELFDRRYFLEIPYDTCKKRRSSRVYSPPDPPGYFDGYVWPMYLKNRREMESMTSEIGVLTQIVSDDVMKPFGRTYIPDSYVNYIESGGSRVMPIRLTLSTAEYKSIFKKINGLFFIGGVADLKTSDFARVAKIFYKLAVTANDAGDFFPIWGTCMGMQLLTVLVAGENLLTQTTAENVALPLNLTTEAHSSRMFQGFPKELIKALTEEPVTGNFHNFGLTVKTFQESEKLSSFFSLLSTNIAENGAHFVSTIEGKRYPFYGVQWHPEVNRFQWDRKLNFPHSSHAVQLSSLLAEFFINEGRRSLHHFDSPEEEDSSLIYKFTPVYTANFTAYEEVYFF